MAPNPFISRDWQRSFVMTAAVLAASVVAWCIGVHFRETVFGKHLGVAMVPALGILVLWLPGIAANRLVGDVLNPLHFSALTWLIAATVSTLTWTPVFHRLRLRSRQDPSVSMFLVGLGFLAWIVGSGIALGQARSWMGWDQLALLVLGTGLCAAFILRALRKHGPIRTRSVLPMSPV